MERSPLAARDEISPSALSQHRASDVTPIKTLETQTPERSHSQMLLTLVALPSWQPAAARQPVLRRSASPRLALVDTKKADLLTAIEKFDAARAIDGTVPVDFGVKGGELDEDSRAPKDLASSGAFYAVSQKVGAAESRYANDSRRRGATSGLRPTYLHHAHHQPQETT